MTQAFPSPLRVLVSGGAGFIGSHLCKRLLAKGHTVVCLDNFHTGQIQHVEPLKRHPRFTLVTHDVVDPFDAEVDRIYNLACPASPIHYQTQPVHTLRTCVMGAMNMLELARKTGARILQASTSEVYGDPQVHPQRESYWGHVNPVGVRSCYDEGKRCAETLFHDYARMYGVKIKIARIFNTYGPNMAPDDGRVVSNFIVQALQGQALTIYGDGSQTRAFCYVDDMVDALERLMESPDDFSGPVNLGNPEELTVLEVARRIQRLAGTDVPLIFKPLPADDPVQRCPDISLAARELGWAPCVHVEDGLRHTIRYFSQFVNADLMRAHTRAAAPL
ncbi:UDP-glucuronic acid decarboxylase family protein [Bordetella flabilis]|uniref:NAD-dependent dehydratase n=1 Tax=Bordetella flabilis TaxID=463014 RepID=A0A193G9W8_9BORD|nr:UDP-glucuronic acid decarboxylase family protein [Bordetella flabilis]ANN76630.1 NAD-dependent dehydratase [Bordetella flabilis]